ncbi:MAG: penicillin-binding protein 1A [Steroidobacteraceae bacterium]
MKPNYKRLAIFSITGLAGLAAAAAYAIACTYVYLNPSLPTVEAMKSAELQVPLRVYTRSGELIAQIGEQRRTPVAYADIPERVKQAFIAAEDDRFFEHSGFDYAGILRSALVNLLPGGNLQGASTITMQTARNLFLSQDRKWRRKLQEVFLTYRLEREFSKEEILGLYMNVIFFGQRAYGVAAAAETYFGKKLPELTLAEVATLARIPQSPSRTNPIANPELAAERRLYVLRRMQEQGYITAAEGEAAAKETVRSRVFAPLYEVEAPYVAEMVRLEVLKRFGPEAQNQGYKVFTTIDPVRQQAANRAVRLGLVEYDRRGGWRGATAQVTLQGDEDAARLATLAEEHPNIGELTPAVITEVAAQSARAYVRGRGFVTLGWEGMAWARRELPNGRVGPEPKTAAEIVARGDVVYVIARGETTELAQVPEAEGALVALDPDDGAIVSLVGGFDYFDKGLGKFNRVTQAKRQPGSGFKPFLYSAALENGFTPASVIMDAPVVIDDPSMEEAWRPENSSGRFGGPTRLREALVRSRNLVSIRLLQAMGLNPAIEHATRFGFAREALPRNLTMALGTMAASPLDMASAFSVFANGGFRVQPYFIERIENPTGEVVYQAEPRVVEQGCELQPGACKLPAERRAERVISAENAWLMDSMMADVITRGTGRRALALGRSDLGGKTGTTNDSKDVWFNGFNRSLVASVWVGFDQEKSLGETEEGGRTALPIWVYYMQEALKGVPVRPRPMPAGLVQVRISPYTGAVASAEDPSAIFETFMANRLPTGGVLGDAPVMPGSGGTTISADPASGDIAPEPIF